MFERTDLGDLRKYPDWDDERLRRLYIYNTWRIASSYITLTAGASVVMHGIISDGTVGKVPRPKQGSTRARENTMTDHELFSAHLANNHRAVLELIDTLGGHVPAMRQELQWIADEHLRVNKEIQAEYTAQEQG